MGYAKKIGTGAIFIYAQNILSAIFGILTAIIVIRSLGITEYGIFTLAMATMGLLTPFLDFGIGQVVTADIAGEIGAGHMDRVRRLYSGYAKTVAMMGLILGVILFVGSFFAVGGRYGNSFPVLLRLASGILFVNPAKNLMLVAFGGFSRFKALGLIQASESAFKFIFVALAVLYFKLSSAGVIAAYLLAMIFSVVFVGLPMLLRVLRQLKDASVTSDPIFKNLLFGHGKFQILSQPVKALYDGIRSWIITLLAGVEALAIFQVAFQIYSYIYLFLGAIEAVMMPIFAEEFARSIEAAKKLLVKMTKYITWLALAVALASLVVIPSALGILFGDKYIRSIPLALFLLIALPMDGFGVILRPALFSIKAQKGLLKILLYTLFIIIPLGALLTKFFGVWGYILVTPFASSIAIYLRYRYLVSEIPEMRFDWHYIFRWDEYDRELLSRIWRKVKRAD